MMAWGLETQERFHHVTRVPGRRDQEDWQATSGRVQQDATCMSSSGDSNCTASEDGGKPGPGAPPWNRSPAESAIWGPTRASVLHLHMGIPQLPRVSPFCRLKEAIGRTLSSGR